MDQWDHQLLQNSEINMPVNSYIPLFEIILVFYKVWSQSFKFQSLFTIHNLFSFSLCTIHLRSFQLSLFTVFSSFQFSVNSKQLVSHLILIQVIHRLTMELLPASYCFRFNVFFYGSLNSLNCSECV